MWHATHVTSRWVWHATHVTSRWVWHASLATTRASDVCISPGLAEEEIQTSCSELAEAGGTYEQPDTLGRHMHTVSKGAFV